MIKECDNPYDFKFGCPSVEFFCLKYHLKKKGKKKVV